MTRPKQKPPTEEDKIIQEINKEFLNTCDIENYANNTDKKLAFSFAFLVKKLAQATLKIERLENELYKK